MHYIQGYYKGKGGVEKRGKYEKSCALPVVKNMYTMQEQERALLKNVAEKVSKKEYNYL